MTRELTGRHVLIIALTAFATIITANMVMLFAATGSFPGLVVKNAYVASQGWNARTDAQRDLGWQTSVTYVDAELRVEIGDHNGAVNGLTLVAILGRPASDTLDRKLELIPGPDGYSATINLAPGAWRLKLRSTAPAYHAVADVYVGEDQ